MSRPRLGRGPLGSRILDRYVLRKFFRIFALCVLGVPFVLIVIDLVDSLQGFLAEGATPFDVLLHYVFQFPYHSLLSFPIAALLAAVFTISGMTRYFEVTAVKAGGVSFYRLSAPLVLAGLAVSVVALGLTELVPHTNRMAQDVLGEGDLRSQSLRQNFVFRAEGGRVYRIGGLDVETGEMSRVRVEREGSTPEYPTYSVVADSAAWNPAAGRWVIREGRLRVFPARAETHTFRFDELWQLEFTEQPEELLADPKDPDEMGYEELGRYIQAIERSGGTAGKEKVERALKISYPFTCLIIVIFGLPLANRTRRGGAPFAIGVALAITIVFLMIIRIAQGLGAGGILPPVAAAWLPNGLFLVAGLILFRNVRT